MATILDIKQGSQPEPDPEEYPFGKTLEEMDVRAFMNVRDWLENCLISGDAEIVGGGIGAGRADVQIFLEGQRYGVSIRPKPPVDRSA